MLPNSIRQLMVLIFVKQHQHSNTAKCQRRGLIADGHAARSSSTLEVCAARCKEMNTRGYTHMVNVFGGMCSTMTLYQYLSNNLFILNFFIFKLTILNYTSVLTTKYEIFSLLAFNEYFIFFKSSKYSFRKKLKFVYENTIIISTFVYQRTATRQEGHGNVTFAKGKEECSRGLLFGNL